MLAFLLVFSCVLTACTPRRGAASSDSSSNPLKGADASGDTRLNVVTTLFPYYDFLRQIAGDSIRLTMVVPAGMDSHSFEPTPADMITIQNADLLVCNGGTMEQWLSQVLDSFEKGTGPKRVVTMMDYVDVVQEEIVEGMEDGEAHDHGHTHVHADGTVHAG
ncbi:metal ABC transporter substrate-binding protein, partial [uncultured Clostridium sp.]|uniref:metal ABC transporter substrate-binding protein n=1 Tax=uncultured Clostridium sp. TaxID=59620 RepID=UPI0025830468